MREITHIAFSSSFCLTIATALNIVLKPLDFIFIIIASILPDIDNTKKIAGKIYTPLSSYIEKYIGRRTLTHSLIGIGMWMIIFLPTLLIGKSLYLMAVLSMISHIILDCLNKEGVRLFYPNLIRGVIPKSETMRIEEGSVSEKVCMYVCFIFMLLTYPLNQIGIKPAMHQVIQTQQAARSDYMKFSNDGYRVIVDVNGIRNNSQEKIKGKFEAIDLAARNSLLVKDGQGILFTVGNDVNDNVRPITIRALKQDKICKVFTKIYVKNDIMGNVLQYILGKRSYITGLMIVDGAPDEALSVETYLPIKVSGNRVELNNASVEDIFKYGLGSVFIEKAELYVRTVYPYVKGQYIREERTYYLKNDKVLLLEVNNIRGSIEMWKREGQRVRKGDVIAALMEFSIKYSNKEMLEPGVLQALEEKKWEDEILGIKRDLRGLFVISSPCDGRIISIILKDGNLKVRITNYGKY